MWRRSERWTAGDYLGEASNKAFGVMLLMGLLLGFSVEGGWRTFAWILLIWEALGVLLDLGMAAGKAFGLDD